MKILQNITRINRDISSILSELDDLSNRRHKKLEEKHKRKNNFMACGFILREIDNETKSVISVKSTEDAMPEEEALIIARLFSALEHDIPINASRRDKDIGKDKEDLSDTDIEKSETPPSSDDEADSSAGNVDNHTETNSTYKINDLIDTNLKVIADNLALLGEGDIVRSSDHTSFQRIIAASITINQSFAAVDSNLLSSAQQEIYAWTRWIVDENIKGQSYYVILNIRRADGGKQIRKAITHVTQHESEISDNKKKLLASLADRASHLIAVIGIDRFQHLLDTIKTAPDTSALDLIADYVTSTQTIQTEFEDIYRYISESEGLTAEDKRLAEAAYQHFDIASLSQLKDMKLRLMDIATDDHPLNSNEIPDASPEHNASAMIDIELDTFPAKPKDQHNSQAVKSRLSKKRIR